MSIQSAAARCSSGSVFQRGVRDDVRCRSVPCTWGIGWGETKRTLPPLSPSLYCRLMQCVRYDGAQHTRLRSSRLTRSLSLPLSQAQSEAIHLLASHKANDNPENTVGILTLAGKNPRVLVTPTSDLGKILGAMHGLGMEGESNVCSGMQVRAPPRHTWALSSSCRMTMPSSPSHALSIRV